MFYLELTCAKCKASTDFYSSPNHSYDSFKCPECGSKHLNLAKAQSLDGKAIAVAIADLDKRLKVIEGHFEEAEAQGPANQYS